MYIHLGIMASILLNANARLILWLLAVAPVRRADVVKFIQCHLWLLHDPADAFRLRRS